MARLWDKTVNITYNPSGAAAAARQGNLVMIVDLIDMSTTAETALQGGAIDVLGASSSSNIPITVNPEKIGYIAGKRALKHDTKIIIAVEPRIFSRENKDEREKNISPVIKGIKKGGAELEEVVPNLGKEIVNLVDCSGKLLIVVSASGGACFDAAYNYGAPTVITGTVARAGKLKGDQPAIRAAERAIEGAEKFKCGISIVASSSNAREDILAAEYITGKIIDLGFLNK